MLEVWLAEEHKIMMELEVYMFAVFSFLVTFLVKEREINVITLLHLY